MIDSLIKDDGNANDVTNQKHDWLNERNNRAARVARFLVQFFDVAISPPNYWNFHFWGSDDIASSSPTLYNVTKMK